MQEDCTSITHEVSLGLTGAMRKEMRRRIDTVSENYQQQKLRPLRHSLLMLLQDGAARALRPATVWRTSSPQQAPGEDWEVRRHNTPIKGPCSTWGDRKQPRGRRNNQQTEEVVGEWWLWCLKERWYG
ncbi:hypothetical protein INR49_018253 [Caranx melampygus]|nr:hypothetical protein INR49_018253 [Caranx melampygus]